MSRSPATPQALKQPSCEGSINWAAPCPHVPPPLQCSGRIAVACPWRWPDCLVSVLQGYTPSPPAGSQLGDKVIELGLSSRPEFLETAPHLSPRERRVGIRSSCLPASSRPHAIGLGTGKLCAGQWGLSLQRPRQLVGSQPWAWPEFPGCGLLGDSGAGVGGPRTVLVPADACPAG